MEPAREVNKEASQNSSESGSEINTSEVGFRYVYSPNIDPQAIIDQYGEQAEGYDANMGKWGFLTPDQSTEVLKEFLDPDAKILEAGCGTGLSDEHHFTAGFRNLHGVDLSPEMLKIAEAKNIHQSLKEGNLLVTLPYQDNEFDAAVCVAVFTHIDDAEPVLREFARVVRDGGKIIFSQREDLYETREMEALLNKLEDEGIIRKISQSDWLPYVTNHEAYVKCGITVGYFVYEVTTNKD